MNILTVKEVLRKLVKKIVAYILVEGVRTSKSTMVKEFIHNGAWRLDELLDVLLSNVINTIQKIKVNESNADCPY